MIMITMMVVVVVMNMMIIVGSPSLRQLERVQDRGYLSFDSCDRAVLALRVLGLREESLWQATIFGLFPLVWQYWCSDC